jgi:hypothetical protein
VKVNYNLQTVPRCPADSFKEVLVLPLNIRFVRCDFVGPITYRNAHVIKSTVNTVLRSVAAHAGLYKDAPSPCDRLKVDLSNPRIPMFHQLFSCDIKFLEMRKRPFVYDGGVARVVKQAWCYPWLCDSGK